MRQLIFIFLATCRFVIVHGQDSILNFHVENGKVIWREKIRTNLSTQEVIKGFKIKGVFEDFNVDSLQLNGQLKATDIDYNGTGYSSGNAPVIFINNRIRGTAFIQFDSGMYSIQVSNIILKLKVDVRDVPAGWTFPIEGYILYNNRFTKGFKRSPSAILNHTFQKLFTL